VRTAAAPTLATLRVARGHRSRGYSPRCDGTSETCSRGTCGREAVRSTTETDGDRCSMLALAVSRVGMRP